MKKSLLIVLFCQLAVAGLEDNYGLGGISTGRAGNVTTETDQSFSALFNPALLPFAENSNLQLSTLSTTTSLSPLHNVLLDSPKYRTTDGISRTGDINFGNPSELHWALGLEHPWQIAWLNRRAGIGVVMSGPFNRMRSLAATTPYDFSDLRYGNSDGQWKGTLGAGLELVPDTLSIGAGLTLYIASSGVADATLSAQNPTSRMAVDMGFNTALNAGAFYKSEANELALVFKQALDPSFEQQMNGTIQVGGSSVQQPFLLRTSLYYEPAAASLEFSRLLGTVKTTIGLAYEFWQSYRPPFLIAETKDSQGNIVKTEEPALSLRNTFNPRISAAFPLLKNLELDAGYQFRPTPITAMGDAANLMDTDTHILGLALSHHWQNPLFSPFVWGIYGQYHYFQPRDVTKANPDFIGAPGYRISGYAYAFGAYLQTGL